MNTRICLIALALLASAAPAAAQPSAAAPLARPGWLPREPLVIIGNWDSMPIFRRRVGATPAWQEEDYAKEHTEEAVVKLKELGVTMAVIHFYKGYGLEAEREHMADARRLAALCKKHGIRVGVYVGSTIAFETFLKEKPEAAEWIVPRYLGRPVFYGDQTFRKRVYFMHPGYREYMKRVVTIAVKDFQADLIHFDNTSLQAQAPIFFHPMAVEDFRAFLRRKYTPAQLERRFGFSDVSLMEPPELERTPAQINDPLHQEWADFRCHQLTEYYAEMERHIRGLNPETAVESNPHSGISGRNVVWEQGIDYPRLLRHMDVVWTEEGNEPGVTAEGILISKIRTFKMAARYGVSIFTYTGGTRGGELAMAEAMAFNRRNLGMVGGALAGYELPERQRRYVRFYRDQFDSLYRDGRSRADVAVLYGYASMAYNNEAPWQSSMLVEQALIEARVPFDIIFDEHLRDLARYHVLVLADQESLSDEQAARVSAWVKAGGGLLATGQTSLYTEERRRRRNFALSEIFGVNAEAVGDKPVRTEPGRGRSVYIPAVKPARAKPPGVAMTSQYWALPANWREVIDGVRWAAGGEFSLEVTAPPHVVAEAIDQPGRVLVHLLNYAAERGPVGGRIEVNVALPAGKAVRAATLLSPDHAARKVEVEMQGGRARFSVPDLNTYAVALLELQ